MINIIDLSKITFEPYKKKWQFCVGSGNAKLALQTDYQEQLKYIHDQLGFKRVRFHGIFNDGLYVVRGLDDLFNLNIDTPNIREISFQQVGKILDAVIKSGVKPFIEIGMMPRLLAKDDKSIFKYKDYVSMPKNINEWNNLVQYFIQFIVNRYGIDEVKTWYFEVWNEPDIPNFFNGTIEDYFELYANTANTIKELEPSLMVGGPATSKSKWINEFKLFCETNNVPFDFVSTHHYPGDALGHSFDRSKHQEKIMNVISQQSTSFLSVARAVILNEEKIKNSPSNLLLNNAKKTKEICGEVPVFYTEWNVTSNTVAPQNDTQMNAAYIVKTVLELEDVIEGHSFWTFSDIFEELAYFTDPFHGGFGLLTIDGIEKPNFNGFKFLNELGDEKCIIRENDEHVHVSIHRFKSGYQLILTNHYFDINNGYSEEFEFNIKGIRNVDRITVKSINQFEGNSYTNWLNMGSPKPLNHNEIQQLRKSSIPNEKNQEYYESEDLGVVIKGELDINDTKLITIYCKEEVK